MAQETRTKPGTQDAKQDTCTAQNMDARAHKNTPTTTSFTPTPTTKATTTTRTEMATTTAARPRKCARTASTDAGTTLQRGKHAPARGAERSSSRCMGPDLLPTTTTPAASKLSTTTTRRGASSMEKARKHTNNTK